MELREERKKKMKNVIIIPPDGTGSKGDEAMVRGALNLYYGSGNIVVFTPRKQLWKEWIIDKSNLFQEKYVPLEKISDEIDEPCRLVVIGADLMDGIFDSQSVLYRLNAAEKVIALGGEAEVISCSFRDDVNSEILDKIKSVGPSLKWYLRDKMSLKNFEAQTGLQGVYFPDLAFQYDEENNARTEEILNSLDTEKQSGRLILGINICEHSFRGFYNNTTKDERQEYIYKFAQNIVDIFGDACYVLISNDVRKWENHWSDMDFLKYVEKYLKESEKKTIVVDEYCPETEILSILRKVDVLVSGRMHLTIAAMRSGCFPIAYFGNTGKFRDILKFKGMFLECLGRNDFVISDFATLRSMGELYLRDSQTIRSGCEKYWKSFETELNNLTEKVKRDLGTSSAAEVKASELYPEVIERFFEKNSEIKALGEKNNEQYWKLQDKQKIITEKLAELEDIRRQLTEKETEVAKLQNENNSITEKLQSENRCLVERLEEKISDLQKELEVKTQTEKSISKQLSYLREKSYADRKEAYKKIDELIEEKNFLLDRQAQLEQEVKNKEGHIELLLPPEREYKKIINSKMFKIMRFVCRSYDIVMIVPRFVGRNIAAFCRMMTHVNVPELKIAWGYVKNEGLIGAYHHLMKDYHQGELKQIQVEVEEKIFDEITDINTCEKITFPVVENPMVSIVIPAYNQFTYTYYCLKSILENSGDISYEVILADDCSTDISREIQKVVENLIVARTEQNMLFLRNCNHAAQKAKGKYILFLNNDTQVQKDWLKPLVDLVERKPEIGMVGSKLVYADGSLQEAGGIIWKDGSAWNYGRNLNAEAPEYNYVKEVDYISGAAIMIRSDLWKKIGGFDERYAPAYCEDSDLAFEVRKAGYKVVYQPLSVVVHFEGKSNGTDLNTGVKKYQVENNLKLREKWKEEFQNLYDNGQHVFKARERSRDKKVILIIDHYVPQYDKDAGSKTTFQYIKMFVKQGYSVKFMGDNFYQDEPYTTTLQQMGVEVLYGPWYAQHWKEWILENKNEIDFAYLNRPHITIKYIDFLKNKTNIKCIYYGHDLHFLRLRREYELTGDKSKLTESEEWMEKELYIMNQADMNYYPSYVEEDEIHKINSKIRVKAITAYVFEEFLNNQEKDFTKREGIVFVGGFGHPPNEDAVLWFVEKVLPLIEKEKEIPFYIVGSHPTDKIKAIKQKNVILKGFVSEEELQELYNTCKMVVVPLRYGAGVKGKVVEALYYGTPMVTTSVGVEGIQGAEDIIRVEDKAEDFAKAVVTLYADNAALEKTLDNYQKFVKSKFSVDAVWDIIKDDFK